MLEIGIISLVVLVLLAGIGTFIVKSYRYASKNIALIRTGAGKKIVCTDGGVIAIGGFHNILEINMTTKKLPISQRQGEALVTGDKLLVDVDADFFIRVMKDESAIEAAGAALSDKTGDELALRTLVEGKFCAALRNVAANMELEALHSDRVEFQRLVIDNLRETLAKNGLELEDVALTSLNPTDKQYYNEEDPMHAVGLTKICSVEEEQTRKREEIVNTSSVTRKKKDVETRKATLDLEKEETLTELTQKQELATQRATQQTAIATVESEEKVKGETVRIDADRRLQDRELESKQQIAKKSAEADREIQIAQLDTDRAVQQQRVETSELISMAEADSNIKKAKKAQELSAANAVKNEKAAIAVKAEESVETAAATAKAERAAKIAIIEASQTAEEQAVSVTISAKAEADAADLKANTIIKTANANAEAIIIAANAEEKRVKVEAEGQQLLAEARNSLSEAQTAVDRLDKTLGALPAMIEASSAAVANIDSINITDISGINGGTGGTGENASGSMVEQVFDKAQQHKVLTPVLSKVMKDSGLTTSNPLDMINEAVDLGITPTAVLDK